MDFAFFVKLLVSLENGIQEEAEAIFSANVVKENNLRALALYLNYLMSSDTAYSFPKWYQYSGRIANALFEENNSPTSKYHFDLLKMKFTLFPEQCCKTSSENLVLDKSLQTLTELLLLSNEELLERHSTTKFEVECYIKLLGDPIQRIGMTHGIAIEEPGQLLNSPPYLSVEQYNWMRDYLVNAGNIFNILGYGSRYPFQSSFVESCYALLEESVNNYEKALYHARTSLNSISKDKHLIPFGQFYYLNVTLHTLFKTFIRCRDFASAAEALTLQQQAVQFAPKFKTRHKENVAVVDKLTSGEVKSTTVFFEKPKSLHAIVHARASALTLTLSKDPEKVKSPGPS